MLDKQMMINILKEPEVSEEISKNFSIILYNAKSGVSGIQNYSDHRSSQRAMEENSQFRAKLKIINGDIKQLEYEERRMNNQSSYATGVHWVPLERKTEANITQTQNDNIRDDSRLQDMIRNTEEHGNFSSGFLEFKDKVENLIKAYLAKFHPYKLNSQANWFKNLDVSDSEPTPSAKSDIPTNERFRNLDIDNVNSTKPNTNFDPSKIDQSEFMGPRDKYRKSEDKKIDQLVSTLPKGKPMGQIEPDSIEEVEKRKNAEKQAEFEEQQRAERMRKWKEERDKNPTQHGRSRYLEIDESKKNKNRNQILSERIIYILKNIIKD